MLIVWTTCCSYIRLKYCRNIYTQCVKYIQVPFANSLYTFGNRLCLSLFCKSLQSIILKLNSRIIQGFCKSIFTNGMKKCNNHLDPASSLVPCYALDVGQQVTVIPWGLSHKDNPRRGKNVYSQHTHIDSGCCSTTAILKRYSPVFSLCWI